MQVLPGLNRTKVLIISHKGAVRSNQKIVVGISCRDLIETQQ